MKILVLGGAGYIGSHTVYRLIESGNEVVDYRNISKYLLRPLKSTKQKPSISNLGNQHLLFPYSQTKSLIRCSLRCPAVSILF